jgi:hypothetical protein
MELLTLFTLQKDEKMHKFLRENSEWYKYLNRSSANYPYFVQTMKKKYHLNVTDKISDTIDNIDLISSVIKTIK